MFSVLLDSFLLIDTTEVFCVLVQMTFANIGSPFAALVVFDDVIYLLESVHMIGFA